MAKELTETFSIDGARDAYAPALRESMARPRSLLWGIMATPPQVLLLEGGREEERQAMARWWAALQHCDALAASAPDQTTPHTHVISSGTGPCGQCAPCLHIGAGLHLDVLAFDGRISNKEDEENPGAVRAFNMDNARALKARIGDSTRSGRRRVVIMSGLDITRDAAANALLKVLEEPSPTTSFVLLTPQREQLLPTLISRSWVLTLPWPDARAVDPALAPWEEGLTAFLGQGRHWWPLTSAKGAVDQDLAGQVVLLCQKRLLAALELGGEPPRAMAAAQTLSPLSLAFARLGHMRQVVLGRLLEQAQEALQYNVNPARVLDWLAVRLFVLHREATARVPGHVVTEKV